MGSLITKSENISASTYQNLDGSNYTVVGLEEKLSSDSAYASVFLGGGTDFNKTVAGVFDIKYGINYDKKGISNQNLRIRTKFGKFSESVQIRYSPISLNIPISKNTNIYVNPHYSGQMDFKKDKWTNSIGTFAGISQKLNDKTTLSLEAQRYNLQDIKDNSGKNWGINAIISYKF